MLSMAFVIVLLLVLLFLLLFLTEVFIFILIFSVVLSLSSWASVWVNEEGEVNSLGLLAWAGLLNLEDSLSRCHTSQDEELLAETKRWGRNRDVGVSGDLEDALIQELTVLLPVLTVQFVLNTGNENKISDVDAESVIFVLSELSFVVQVDDMNLSSPASFSSSFLELEDFLTLVSASILVV